MKPSADPGQNGVAGPGKRALGEVGMPGSGSLHGLSHVEILSGWASCSLQIQSFLLSLM